MGCDITDFRCILVSEIAGSAFLAFLLILLFYFVATSKLNWTLRNTLVFLVPLLLIGGLMITGFTAVLAFVTIVVSLMLAWMINRMLGNR